MRPPKQHKLPDVLITECNDSSESSSRYSGAAGGAAAER